MGAIRCHHRRRRIFLLRTLSAFVLQTAARLPEGPSLELPELMEALQRTFQQTYDAQVGGGDDGNQDFTRGFGDLDGDLDGEFRRTVKEYEGRC